MATFDPSKPWMMRLARVEGKISRKRKSETLGYVAELTRKQAQKLAAEKLLPLNQGKLTPMAMMTFEDFIECLFIPNALPTLKQSTRKRYRSTVNFHLKPAFGHKRLCDNSSLNLQAFVLSKMDAGSGWEVCSHLPNLMSLVFNSAKKWGHYAGGNPATGVDLPEKIMVHERHALSAEQTFRLFALLPEPVRTMVQVGIYGGLRIGEVLGLRWQDVDFSLRSLHVRQAAYRGTLGTPKTKGSRRTVPIPAPLEEALQRHHQRSGKHDGLVFPTSAGTPHSDTNLAARNLNRLASRLPPRG